MDRTGRAFKASPASTDTASVGNWLTFMLLSLAWAPVLVLLHELATPSPLSRSRRAR